MRPPYRPSRWPGRAGHRTVRGPFTGASHAARGPLTHAEGLVCFNSLAMPARTPRISVASPTGQQWRIGHGRQEVIVCEVGATLRAYSVGDHPVLDGFGADEWSHSGRGQVLAPWPNRLADGRYEFNGVRAQAALDEPERRNAIHGLVRWMPWTLQTRHQNQLSLRLQLHPSPGYPFSLLLEIDYHVGREGLTVTTTGAVARRGLRSPSASASTPISRPGPETVDGAILHLPGAPHPRPRRPGAADRSADSRSRAPSATSPRRASSGPAVLDTAFTSLDRDADGKARATPRCAGRRHAGPRCGSTPASPTSWCTRATRCPRCRAAGAAWPLSR